MRLIVLTLAALVLAGGVASGCGGGGGGDEPTVEPGTTTTATGGGGQAASGAELFSSNCESCHGIDGAGGHVGPNLQKSSVAENLTQVEKQIHNGGGAMPPFTGVLSDEEITLIAKYVVEEIAPKE